MGFLYFKNMMYFLNIFFNENLLLLRFLVLGVGESDFQKNGVVFSEYMYLIKGGLNSLSPYNFLAFIILSFCARNFGFNLVSFLVLFSTTVVLRGSMLGNNFTS